MDTLDVMRRASMTAVTVFSELLTAVDLLAAERGLQPIGERCGALTNYLLDPVRLRQQLDLDLDHEIPHRLIIVHEWIATALDHLRDNHPEHYALIADLQDRPIMTHLADELDAGLREIIAGLSHE